MKATPPAWKFVDQQLVHGHGIVNNLRKASKASYFPNGAFVQQIHRLENGDNVTTIIVIFGEIELLYEHKPQQTVRFLSLGAV